MCRWTVLQVHDSDTLTLYFLKVETGGKTRSRKFKTRGGSGAVQCVVTSLTSSVSFEKMQGYIDQICHGNSSIGNPAS